MITIRRTYMTHSGGTKFYQPFLVNYVSTDGDLSSAATVIHFGPVSSGGAGSNGRPVLGGQIQIRGGAAHYQNQIDEKSKRTARGHYSQVHSTDTGYASDAGRDELVRLFGAKNTESILLELGLKFDGAEASPTTHRETAPTPIEKPAHQGTW